MERKSGKKLSQKVPDREEISKKMKGSSTNIRDFEKPKRKTTQVPATSMPRRRWNSVELDPEAIKSIPKNLPTKKKKYLNETVFNKEYQNYPECITSKKPFVPIKAYAMNSYQGIERDYNEDKIVAVLNINKPQNYHGIWPKCSYFGVFDGHAGETCAIFLQKNLLNYIISQKLFPLNPKESIKAGFEKAVEDWTKEALENDKETGQLKVKNDSGSCAVICLIIENRAFIANVGDSRAVISYEEGKKVKQITVDHKPNEPNEKNRIEKAGGEVYADKLSEEELEEIKKQKKEEKEKEKEAGEMESFSSSSDADEEEIYRINPGRLAVSRSIGDMSTKTKELGGLPGAVISEPDIFEVELTFSADFILMGCDGIFDVLSSEEAIETAWYADNFSKNCGENLNLKCANFVNNVIKAAMELKSSDNLSCIIIGLPNLEKVTKTKLIKEKVMASLGKK